MATKEAKVYLQTDKKKTKDCQCTYPGCINICRVNQFYAPAKARCGEHKGSKGTFVKNDQTGELEEFEVQVLEETVAVDVRPNDKLRHLLCPICESDEPLEILACTETGHIDLGCQNCQTITAITFNFRSAQIRSVPDRLIPIVEKFNIKQVGTMDESLAQKLDKFYNA